MPDAFTIRDADAAEQKLIEEGRCPFCGNNNWLEGPRGGMAVNMMCDPGFGGCGAKINYCLPFTCQIIGAPTKEFVPIRVVLANQAIERQANEGWFRRRVRRWLDA